MQKSDKLIAGSSIVLFGGSFDPIHCGHLQIAQSVLKAFDVEHLVFIPSQQAPLKGFASVASPEDRLKMVSLAITGENRFVLDSLEVDRGGTSYSSETIEIYRARYPQKKLYWLLGEDQFANLQNWNAIEFIIREVEFLVYPRVSGHFSGSDMDGIRYEWLDCPRLNVSSTNIRERSRASQSIKGLVPRSVEAFIHSRQIYQV